MNKLNLVLVIGSLCSLAACQEEAPVSLEIAASSVITSEAALKHKVEPTCKCEDKDGKIVWKFTIKERDLDRCDIDLELRRGDVKVISKAIKGFLGYKFDRDDLSIETKEFKNRTVVTVTLYGIEIPESKEAYTLDFKVNGNYYTLHGKEFELVNGKWRPETAKNDEEKQCD